MAWLLLEASSACLAACSRKRLRNARNPVRTPRHSLRFCCVSLARAIMHVLCLSVMKVIYSQSFLDSPCKFDPSKTWHQYCKEVLLRFIGKIHTDVCGAASELYRTCAE